MASNGIFRKLNVLDGGMGSLLLKRGFPISEDPLWSARVLAINPDAVQLAHIEFLEAGANILETCSYQASLTNLAKYLKISRIESEKILADSVFIARKSVEKFSQTANPSYKLYVAGSVGSYGVVLHDKSEYTGSFLESVDKMTIYQYYMDQIKVLIDARVDLLAFETIASLDEAKIIVKAMDELRTHIPYWISFYCNDVSNTGSGDDFASVVCALSEYNGLSAIGINCTNPLNITSLLKASKSDKPFVVYPNFYTACTDTELRELVSEWIKLGAKVIGGCCNFGPDQIHCIRSIVDIHS